MEFIVRVLTFFILGFVMSRAWNYLTVYVIKTYKCAHIKGIHFHHSLFGVISIFLAVYFFLNRDLEKFFILTSFGIGIIVEHTLSVCGFVFITKD